jgi:hypothetical protein
MRLLFMLIFLSVVSCVGAQSLDSIQRLFPGEEAVMQNVFMHYTISVKNNEPAVESEETEQIKYLSAHAASYMSQYGFVQSDFQEVSKYQAYTMTSDNHKLKVQDFKTSNYKDASVFYDDVKQTRFDFPAVGAGAVGTLEIERVHHDAHLLSPFFFSRFIPVLKSELKVSFPKDMSVKYVLLGSDTSRINVVKESRGGQYHYIFTFINCPAGKNYPDAPNMSWYAPHVIFYIERFRNDKGETVPFLSSVDDLYHLNYSFLKTINKEISPELSHIVDSLTSKVSTDEQKARSIYSWVQKNIKYVAFEKGMEGFIPRDASLVCKRRFGDCKDMSSILTVMLNAAGIHAYYTWIGTRHLAYNFSKLPLPLVSNHMICTILLNGKYIFLDGTHPTCTFGMPPDGIQDKEAMLAIDENQYKILKVPVIEKAENVLTDSTFLELTNEGLKGKITEDLSGYFSIDIRGMLFYADATSLKERMKNRLGRGSNKFRLDSLYSIDTKKTEITKLKADFTLPDYARKIGGEWYINLNLFRFFEHEEIDYPKRTIPVESDYNFIQRYVTLLKIPEGCHITDLPEGKTYRNETWGFDMQYKVKDNWLILTQEFDNNSLLMQPAQFSAWNKVLENIFPMYKDVVSISQK